MRIRKNANLSSLMSSHASGGEALQTHVCQLNQSPWDVIPFSQETYPSCSPKQFEREDSFNGNGSLGDSIGVVESAASMMEDSSEKAVIEMKVNSVVIDDNYEMDGFPEKKRVSDDYEIEFKVKKGEKNQCCNKSDGKGWHCKNKPREGYSMCEHHLSLLKSYSSNNVTTSCVGLTGPSIRKLDKGSGITGARRGRANKAAKKGSSSSSNPYEFYYYSGFGPLWGRRRGDRGEVSKGESKDAENNNIGTCISGAVDAPQNTTPSSTTSSPIEPNEELDYVDEDDEEEDNEKGDSTKKWMRKPVKARSLKSLM